MNRKKGSVLLTVLVAGSCLMACGSNPESGSKEEKNPEAVKVVAVNFPEYDWARTIIGEDNESVELTLLLKQGVDIHSYQPNVADLVEISDCDLFLYVGGTSVTWVDDALKEGTNPDRIVLKMFDVLGDLVKEEEVVEGMQTDHDHEADHDGHEDADHEGMQDEHVWLSLKNAKQLCQAIEAQMEVIDPAQAERYQQNAADYQAKLDELDQAYAAAVDAASQKTLLFGDRFPFRYLVDDYGLEYYAAFSGCYAETEASFETITFLAQKVDELDLKAILTIEKSDEKIAKTVRENTKEKNQTILQMNSLQSVTSEELAEGITYLSVMESNLDVLKEAIR